MPLALDHIQEVAVIDNTLKDRSQSQTIMTAEGRGKSYYWYSVRKNGRLNSSVGMQNIGIK
jgi:hypothetical protein